MPGARSGINVSARRSDALQTRSAFWSLIGLGMLLFIVGLGVLILQQVNQSDYWVEHTWMVIGVNQRLTSEVQAAESAERGFIITGDPSYLQPYEFASQDLTKTVAELAQLVADNPNQREKLTRLDVLLKERMAVLTEAVRQRGESGFQAAQRVVIDGQGRRVMSEIHDISDAIEADEYGLLQERSKLRQARIRSGWIAALGAALLVLVAFFIGFLDVRRAIQQRNAAQQQKAESESTAHAIFESAAQSILMVDRGGKIVSANRTTYRMFGYGENELAGQSIELLSPESARAAHVGHRDKYFQNAQNRPMGQGLDLQARKKDGSTFYAEISLSFVQSAVHGTLAVAFVTDISKRRADDEAIRQHREDLRRLAGRLMTAQDDERRRIARNLHDDLSQKLAFLAMDIGKLAGGGKSPEVVDELRILQRQAAGISESVRHISHQLHPSILDDIGLEAALEQYCEEFEERFGITTRFVSRCTLDNPPREVAGNIYHIFQEALHNVVKHAKAQQVFVTLESMGNVLRLTVEDKGIGLPREALQARAGIGIVSMKERALLVNGRISIESDVGKGTQVSVDIPV